MRTDWRRCEGSINDCRLALKPSHIPDERSVNEKIAADKEGERLFARPDGRVAVHRLDAPPIAGYPRAAVDRTQSYKTVSALDLGLALGRVRSSHRLLHHVVHLDHHVVFHHQVVVHHHAMVVHHPTEELRRCFALPAHNVGGGLSERRALIEGGFLFREPGAQCVNRVEHGSGAEPWQLALLTACFLVHSSELESGLLRSMNCAGSKRAPLLPRICSANCKRSGRTFTYATS